MKQAEYFVFTTEQNVTVKDDELISTTEYITIDEVSYKTVSLQPGSTVF
jgi:hypothetical protein